MHITLDVVLASLPHLRKVHPFFGVTFLVCKKAGLPVGKTMAFPINAEEEKFLKEHYRPDLRSAYLFQPFKTSGHGWTRVAKYASSGLQSIRTRGDLSKAFLHERGTDLWGWAKNYISSLQGKLELDKTERIPAFWLATWLYRSRDWPRRSSARDILEHLFREFRITNAERDALFDVTVPTANPFLDSPAYSDAMLLRRISSPPDASPLEGGALTYLSIDGVGPSRHLEFQPGNRLTLLTGDNGLGKTFVLECAWWSLTGVWADPDHPVLPRLDAAKREPKIAFEIAATPSAEDRNTISFDWTTHSWPSPKNRPTIPGLIVYARVDGSFAVWDPVKHAIGMKPVGKDTVLAFSRDDVLNGNGRDIEGLIRDWVKWQNNPSPDTFHVFTQVVERLSPPEMRPLRPGRPVRLPDDPRDIPTISHEYGDVPFLHESAGIRRIVTIAYLLVWAWTEHQVRCGLARKACQRKMVILLDEVEAHLHPKWQRELLPALLEVTSYLSSDVRAQLIVTTHSPLVLASVETQFNADLDRLFHLRLSPTGAVDFAEMPFVRHGRIDAWLTSDVFELRQARSREGERAIERAREIFAKDEVSKDDMGNVSRQLKESLATDDPFWPRWTYFAEQKGIAL